MAGFSVGLLTLLFLMGLVVAAVFGKTVPQDGRFLINVTLALGLALSFGFIGGSAAASGKLPLPFAANHPITFSLGGGVAVFGIALVLAHYLHTDRPPAPSAGDGVASPGQDASRGNASTTVDLRFDVDGQDLSLQPDGGFPNLKFSQHQPSYKPPFIVAFQGDDHYGIPNIPLPADGKIFAGEFRPVVSDGTLRAAAARPPPFELCFSRKASKGPAGEDTTALLRCRGETRGGGKCGPSKFASGWVGPCEQHAFDWGVLFGGTARAQPVAQPVYWAVPSVETLETLNAKTPKGPAYTRFTLHGKPAGPLAGVDYLSFRVRINGVAVHIDDWLPQEMRQPWTPGSDVNVKFALQNLDFSGTHDGWELIEIDLLLYRKAELVGQRSLQTKVVSLRDTATLSDPDPKPLSDGDGGVYEFSGHYVPQQEEDKFGVFLVSTRKLAGAKSVKTRFDAVGWSYDGLETVAVLRPPLVPWRLQDWDNPAYGVLLGLRRPSGQIEFSFNQQEADDLCRAIWAEQPRFPQGLIADSVFRYEWPPRAGPKYVKCRTL